MPNTINYGGESTYDNTSSGLLATTVQGAIDELAQGGGGGGHTIVDGSGTALTQESNLQFVGVNAQDDSTNHRTVITSAIEVTQAQYDAMDLADTLLDDVDYYITDAAPTVIDASHVPYDNTDSGLTATNVQDAIDEVEGDLTNLNASNLPYSSTQSTKQKIDALYDKDRKVVFGGNYMAEAQSSGRIKITQPFNNYQGFTSVSLNTSIVYAGIYGTKSSVGVNITVYSVNIRDNTYVEIVFYLPSGYSLSTYTDLAKGFLLEIPQIVATLS